MEETMINPNQLILSLYLKTIAIISKLLIEIIPIGISKIKINQSLITQKSL